MSGLAAKITFDRGSLQDFDRTFQPEISAASARLAGADHPARVPKTVQHPDRRAVGGRAACGRPLAKALESIGGGIVAIEVRESHAALKRAVMEVLRDAHRSGSPGKFSAQQIAEVISTACEAPRQTGRPIDTWTARELADEAVRRGIVSAISPARQRLSPPRQSPTAPPQVLVLYHRERSRAVSTSGGAHL